MKFGKVKVGMRVRISSNPNGNSFESIAHGKVGVVSYKEDSNYNHVFWDGHRRHLSCAVDCTDGTFDWGSHLNLEEVKDEN